MRDLSIPSRDGDIVLGDDWIAPNNAAPEEMRARRERRGVFSLRTSPLTRKIITFNLIALNVLVAGILYLNSSRDSLAVQRASALVSESELIANVFEAQLPSGADADSIDSGAGLEMFTSASMPHGCDMTAGGGVEMFTTSCTPAGSKAIQGDRVELFTTSC